MVALSALSCKKVLVRFNLKSADPLKIPLSVDFPILENRTGLTPKEEAGTLVAEKDGVNAEFLSDILESSGLFLRKGLCRIYKNSKPHSVAFFSFGDKKEKIRKEAAVRKSLMELLGGASWSVRIYENPGGDFALTINFGCRKPYLAQSGEPLSNEWDFIVQQREGFLVFEPTKNMEQNSAA